VSEGADGTVPRCRPDVVEDDIDATAVRRRTDLLVEWSVRIEPSLGTEYDRAFSLRPVSRRYPDARTERQAHRETGGGNAPAETDHQNGVALGESRASQQSKRVAGGHPERCRLGPPQGGRPADRVAGGDDHSVRVGSPEVFTDDPKVRAKGLLAQDAYGTGATSDGRVDDNLVALREHRDTLANRVHDPGSVGTGNVGESGSGLAASDPQVHVVQGGCAQGHADLAGSRL
jgi:hypothetical protein